MHAIVFEIGDRRFGLEVNAVREIVRAVAIAPLAGAPAIVEGVINLRGTIVPVLDVRQRFGMPRTPLTVDQHFVVARAGTRLVALRVDRALELTTLDDGAVEPLDVLAVASDYVESVAKLPDGVLVIHDLTRLLDGDEGARLDDAVDGERARSDAALGVAT